MGFLLEYFKHPRTIGAVAPSGKQLSRKMMEPIDFASAKVIVEYGPGTGSFTKELIARRKKGTALLLIEQNPEFCRRLHKKYGSLDEVYIVQGSAEDVNRYLHQYGFQNADYVVSGLPFTSLPKEISNGILTATNRALGEAGQFITFQYSLVKRRFFLRYFSITDCLHETRNLPPAYVLVMQNHQKTYA